MSVARGGRLPDAVSRSMQALNQSVDIDYQLWPQDIEGSKVHAEGLARAGVISEADAKVIIDGLDAVAEEIRSGKMKWDPVLEDVHMNIESRLIALVGPVGGKLHTGRSRNDQVATDMRLWVRQHVDDCLLAVADLASAITDRAEEHIDVLMPAYTHLQRGQPSRLSHHLMAWQELLYRDWCRLRDARARLNECPLGAGAAAGSGFPLERTWVAEKLGFDGPMLNSLDATASRDFLMEVTGSLAILGVHLSRIGEEIVLWSSAEFGFISLSDEFSTSSSMMPQKKNPDVAELARGKASRMIGSAVTLLVLEKSLCFGYGRELQEDKLPTFDAFEAGLQTLHALTGAIATATFRVERLEGALSAGHVCATDLADLLVTDGVPFREAHRAVGELVRVAEDAGVQLSALTHEQLSAAHPALKRLDVASALDPRQAVERRALIGGPAKRRVLEAIDTARGRWSVPGQS